MNSVIIVFVNEVSEHDIVCSACCFKGVQSATSEGAVLECHELE